MPPPAVADDFDFGSHKHWIWVSPTVRCGDYHVAGEDPRVASDSPHLHLQLALAVAVSWADQGTETTVMVFQRQKRLLDAIEHGRQKVPNPPRGVQILHVTRREKY